MVDVFFLHVTQCIYILSLVSESLFLSHDPVPALQRNFTLAFLSKLSPVKKNFRRVRTYSHKRNYLASVNDTLSGFDDSYASVPSPCNYYLSTQIHNIM